jgi:hypothetical protein
MCPNDLAPCGSPGGYIDVVKYLVGNGSEVDAKDQVG